MPTDDALEQQLAIAEPSDVIEAIVVLQDLDGTTDLGPDRTARISNQILDRVTERVGYTANDVYVFRNLSRMVVSANPNFLCTLSAQPEVQGMYANRR